MHKMSSIIQCHASQVRIFYSELNWYNFYENRPVV